jgi:hypothetical protein
MDTTRGSNELLQYLLTQANSGNKNWFGWQQQRLTAIYLAYEIAKNHADKMSPEEIVAYVQRLNNTIYNKILTRKDDVS